MFSHFYLRQMRAEELYESLLVATEAQKTRGSYEEQEAAKREWLEQFTLAFGTDETTRPRLQRHDPASADDDERRSDRRAMNVDTGSFLQQYVG